MNQHYEYLIRIANYFFDLNVTQVIDDLIGTLYQFVMRMWRILVGLIAHFNVRQYVDAEKLESDLDIKVDYRELVIWRYWRRFLRYLHSVSEYIPFIPVLIEVSSLIMSPSRILRLWLMSSFIITFICIWAIIATKDVVSNMICKIIGMNTDTFDLDIFLKVSGLIMITVGTLYITFSLYSFDIMNGILCLTVINRVYRNIGSYLAVMESENAN